MTKKSMKKFPGGKELMSQIKLYENFNDALCGNRDLQNTWAVEEHSLYNTLMVLFFVLTESKEVILLKKTLIIASQGYAG